MVHHDEVLEHVWSLHSTSLGKLGELVLPTQELLREVVRVEQVGSEDDLPEVGQSTRGRMRFEPLVK